MEEYSEELRTPPVSLISLVGCPEIHGVISTHLHTEQPPINTLALPDFSKISIMCRSSSTKDASAPVAGIIKRDWLQKHRTRIPSVVAALFNSQQVSGDPAQWLEVCTDLENLKAVTRARNIKLVVIIVQSTNKDDMSEDRTIALRKRAEIDSKLLILITPSDSSEFQQSLKRLGSTFAELANSYYKDEGRRIKMRVEKKSFNSIELNIRSSFKVAVYAEFRRDWVEALRFYEDAYRTLREMIVTSTGLPEVQRLGEIKTVAEQLHFKISTLLLHGGKILDAVTWFRQHHESYKGVVGMEEVAFLHWEWLSRQFLVFAELLETSSSAIQNISSLVSAAKDGSLSEWELYPAYYYQLAGQYLKEKKSSFELAFSMFERAHEINDNAESVVLSAYVGQHARLLEQGGEFTMQPLTDEEYIQYALSEGKRFQDSFEIIALLKKSFESYSSLNMQRMAFFCGYQMAVEYFSVGDFNNAKQFFGHIVGLYRQEGWVTLLWEVLGYLRECSRIHGSVKDFVEYSLEMAALPLPSSPHDPSFTSKGYGPAGPPCFRQRETIQNEVFGIVREESNLASNEGESLTLTEDHPLHLEVDLISPLRVAFLSSVAFHDQTVKPGMPTMITLSLLSQLPLTVEIHQLDIQFNQPQCNFTIINARMPSTHASLDDSEGCRMQSTAVLALVTNKWLRLTYDIKSEQSGKLECTSVIARFGPHFSICSRVESPASMDDLPLWKFEDRMTSFPTKDPALSFAGQKIIQVEEPDPQVDLNLNASGPALVGEKFAVPISVVSNGHPVYSGKLKINLVDARGSGLLSPREMEPSPMENHHVELLGITREEGEEDESLNGSGSIRKVQQSFGLISVPFLDHGDSWSCKLAILWHRPKQIMVYVSLGYSPRENAQKIHVHKSLQIEGKTPVTFSHRLMLPFRRDALLSSRFKRVHDRDRSISLPLDEISILMVSAKNCSEVPLKLVAISIDAGEDDPRKTCIVRNGSEVFLDPTVLVPGEDFKKIFSVLPDANNSNLGAVCLRWRRASEPEQIIDSGSTAEEEVLTKHRLPEVSVELSPLTVSLECPPHVVLGVPFTHYVKIQNRTNLLQEMKSLAADSQNFLLSGPRLDTFSVLPKSEHVLGFKLVPLASGSQQLPKVSVTSVRYSTCFEPSPAESTVFVFPFAPRFEAGGGGEGRLQSIVAK